MEMTRRVFFGGALATGVTALAGNGAPKLEKIDGFDENATMPTAGYWEPFSDKKVRVGIAGNGICQFGKQFIFQYHPNAEVVAVAELDPAKLADLRKATGAKRAYASCEEMIDKEKELDAVFIATDAPSHAGLAIRALKRGLHVGSCVPAICGWDQREQAEEMFELVKKTGLVYAMFETSAFREQAIAMRQLYRAGAFGEIVYAEGEYYHEINGQKPLGSFNGWRDGLPPLYYPTHAVGYYTCTTMKRLVEVSCVGTPSDIPPFKDAANRYKNPFGTEIALFKTSTGGSMRVGGSWTIPHYRGEMGRFWGEKGNFRARFYGDPKLAEGVETRPVALPKSFNNKNYHGGSHGYLTDDFLRAILLKRQPIVDISLGLNTTLAGVYAHRSAMLGSETLKIPLYER